MGSVTGRVGYRFRPPIFVRQRLSLTADVRPSAREAFHHPSCTPALRRPAKIVLSARVRTLGENWIASLKLVTVE